MSTVDEIEHAIEQLPAPELTRLARWILERDNEKWDRQMDQDAAAGKLDFLIKEAKTARKNGTLRQWPGKNS
ncbi:MAG: hypothetical protein HY674_11130 [Chloroflexi bacterium]|nr:hypothetical protein [Chloroflexota bacterium]